MQDLIDAKFTPSEEDNSYIRMRVFEPCHPASMPRGPLVCH